MNDVDYMRMAIELAKKGKGFTNPNPMVGAVIVKDNKIIGQGYHEKCGELHAERNAFANLTESAEGATLYVTLEPCCHYGKTPPCTEAIIENKIARVVIGSRDPNPLVSGKGALQLRQQGILVEEDFLKEECDEINKIFFHYITTKLPYVTLKYAMTVDGKIATKTGDSKWITSERTRECVHKMRHEHMAILAGIETVLADNPMLNVRLKDMKSPVRVILDSHLRIPLDCNIVKTAHEYKTLVAYASGEDKKKTELISSGIEPICVPDIKNEQVSIEELLKELGKRGIDSVLVEGGGKVNDSFRNAGYINQIKTCVGPKLFGGLDAKSPVSGIGVDSVAEAMELELTAIEQLDDDLIITYENKTGRRTCLQES